MDEFALIAEYLAPLASRPGALGLADDAALIDAPPGHVLVASADALVAGVHFREREAPDTVAARALRTNLSDLAAMGAEPHGYLLTLALPDNTDAGWMRAFASRLARDQAAFSVALLGGDTVATPGPLTVSLTVLGFAEPGRLLRRSGARPGDAVCVSGVIGDAALALALPDAPDALWRRFRAPEPRIALGRALEESPPPPSTFPTVWSPIWAASAPLPAWARGWTRPRRRCRRRLAAVSAVLRN